MATASQAGDGKVFPTAAPALAGIARDGMSIMSGGFGPCGIPEHLIAVLRDLGVKGRTVISNKAAKQTITGLPVSSYFSSGALS
jgi:acyl CoA:acetate/3-ketoacid CoA transferase alpha subunit